MENLKTYFIAGCMFFLDGIDGQMKIEIKESTITNCVAVGA